MAESFKYKRLEVSKLLFNSWQEYKILLGRKSYQSKTYSFMFYRYPSVQKFHKKEKGRVKKYCLFKENKGGYCLYERNKWNWYLNQRIKNDLFSNSTFGTSIYNEIARKNKFLEKLSNIVDNFVKKDPANIFNTTEKPKILFKDFEHLIYTLPMLSLSSAILEGTLREILAKYLQIEINKYVDLGNKEGRYKHNNYQKMLVAKQSLIESHSSIGNLLSEYSIIFEFKSTDIIPKNLRDIINSLNTLRNIVAHGTSIVTTNIKVEEDDYFRN